MPPPSRLAPMRLYSVGCARTGLAPARRRAAYSHDNSWVNPRAGARRVSASNPRLFGSRAVMHEKGRSPPVDVEAGKF